MREWKRAGVGVGAEQWGGKLLRLIQAWETEKAGKSGWKIALKLAAEENAGAAWESECVQQCLIAWRIWRSTPARHGRRLHQGR
jgi:hypothetical protein